MKFKISRHGFEKYSNIKFHENPSGGTEAFHERDGQDEANSRFSEFCKRTSTRNEHIMIYTFICASLLRHALLLDNLYHTASGPTAHFIIQSQVTFANLAQNTLNINNPTCKIDTPMYL